MEISINFFRGEEKDFMCKIITVATQKGGVAKTTTTCVLATVLAHNGFRVLAIDMDPQGNLSFAMNTEMDRAPTIYDVLKGDLKAGFAIQHHAVVDTISTNVLLSSIEVEFTGKGREYLLKNVLEPLKVDYDYILIDSPPGLGVLTVNALVAADYLILPMLPDIFSLQGITQVYETVEHVKKTCNPQIKIAGILFTKYNYRTKLANEVHGTAELIAKKLDINIFKTAIRNCLAISEAQSLQCDCIDYAPRSTGVIDYKALAKELAENGI